MPPSKTKPPKDTRPELLAKVKSGLAKSSHELQIDLLLMYFTNADLEGIAKDLKDGCS